ncbi:MAG: hypothetical protein SFY80_03605 [Verrucomicrobiota bacterium]|nr:hypothetical protein [Verrucomicrobiota bacterium]
MKSSFLKILIFGLLSGIFAMGCSKQVKEETGQWWTNLKSPEDIVIQSFMLKHGESKIVNVEGNGIMRLGVLVREGYEMCQENKGSILLKQRSTGVYVGTAFSASVIFDLSLGREFIINNQSSIDTDVLIYRETSL